MSARSRGRMGAEAERNNNDDGPVGSSAQSTAPSLPSDHLGGGDVGAW